MNLLNANIGTNYKGILNLDATTINTPLDATLRAVTDGMGNSSALQLSTATVAISVANNGNMLTLTTTSNNGWLFRDISTLIGVANSTAFFPTSVTPSTSNYTLNTLANGAYTILNSTGNTDLRVNGSMMLRATSSLIMLSGADLNYPAIKRNGAAIDFRLADDSDYCDVNGKHALFTNADGNTTLIVRNTGNGSYNAILDLTERTYGNLYFGGQGLIVKGLNSTFGGTATHLSATVGIKGSGATSATTSLLVQNSVGTEALKIKDDGSMTATGAIGSFNYSSYFTFVCAGGGLLGAGTNESQTAWTINGGDTYLLRLKASGVEKLSVDNNGQILLALNGALKINSARFVTNNGSFYVGDVDNTTSSRVTYRSLGIDSLIMNGAILQLSGTTSSFPAIKRNGAAIDFRLADDSGYCNINAFTGTFLGAVNAGSAAISGGGSILINNGTNGVRFYPGSASGYLSLLDNNAANGVQLNVSTVDILAIRKADNSAFGTIQGKIKTDNAYTAGVQIPTGYITIYDSTGTAYKVSVNV